MVFSIKLHIGTRQINWASATAQYIKHLDERIDSLDEAYDRQRSKTQELEEKIDSLTNLRGDSGASDTDVLQT